MKNSCNLKKGNIMDGLGLYWLKFFYLDDLEIF